MKGGAWTVSYIALWILVLVLALAVVALLRQIGVLHARLHPSACTSPARARSSDEPAPAAGARLRRRTADPRRLHLADVRGVRRAAPVARRPPPPVPRRCGVHVVDLADRDQPVFDAFNVRSTPYLVAVDRAGVVRGRGVANSLEQVEELIRECRPRSAA